MLEQLITFLLPLVAVVVVVALLLVVVARLFGRK